ncbi:MAG: DUF1476 domain-containing protein [Holosporales bacterium]|nr:DUF1476 domain-containing protein [Holosporales bacterium]
MNSGSEEFSESSFFNTVRRNKLVASWVADRLALQVKDRQRYMRSLLLFSILNFRTSRLIGYISKDFEQAGIKITEKEIKDKISDITKSMKAGPRQVQ